MKGKFSSKTKPSKPLSRRMARCRKPRFYERCKMVDWRPPSATAAGYAREKVGTIQPLVRHVPNKQYVAKEAANGPDVPALCTPCASSRLFQRVKFSRAFD